MKALNYELDRVDIRNISTSGTSSEQLIFRGKPRVDNNSVLERINSSISQSHMPGDRTTPNKEVVALYDKPIDGGGSIVGYETTYETLYAHQLRRGEQTVVVADKDSNPVKGKIIGFQEKGDVISIDLYDIVSVNGKETWRWTKQTVVDRENGTCTVSERFFRAPDGIEPSHIVKYDSFGRKTQETTREYLGVLDANGNPLLKKEEDISVKYGAEEGNEVTSTTIQFIYDSNLRVVGKDIVLLNQGKDSSFKITKTTSVEYGNGTNKTATITEWQNGPTLDDLKTTTRTENTEKYEVYGDGQFRITSDTFKKVVSNGETVESPIETKRIYTYTGKGLAERIVYSTGGIVDGVSDYTYNPSSSLVRRLMYQDVVIGKIYECKKRRNRADAIPPDDPRQRLPVDVRFDYDIIITHQIGFDRSTR